MSKTRKYLSKNGCFVGEVIHKLVDNSCGKPVKTGRKFQKSSKNKPKTAFDTLWKAKMSRKVFHRKEFPKKGESARKEIGEKKNGKTEKATGKH